MPLPQEYAVKFDLARLAKAYADQGPGPTLTVLMALMAAIGQAELSLAPPHGPTAVMSAAGTGAVPAADTPAALTAP